MPNENETTPEAVETPETIETPVEVTPEVTPETTEPAVETEIIQEAEPASEVQNTPAVVGTNAPAPAVFEGELDKPELQAIAGAKPMTKEGLEKYIETLKVEKPEKWERRKEELERKLAELSN